MSNPAARHDRVIALFSPNWEINEIPRVNPENPTDERSKDSLSKKQFPLAWLNF